MDGLHECTEMIFTCVDYIMHIRVVCVLFYAGSFKKEVLLIHKNG
jgi:hypothetical protein